MKQPNHFITFVMLACLMSCGPTYTTTFMEPQPAGTSSLENIPKKFQGIFTNVEGESDFKVISKLEIGDTIVHFAISFEEKKHRNDLDSTMLLAGDTLILDYKSNDKIIVKVKSEGDSLVLSYPPIEEKTYILDTENVLKKFKGYYFLSTYINNDGWKVLKVNFNKGKLVISSISKDLDLEDLIKISDNVKDTVSHYEFWKSYESEKINKIRMLDTDSIENIQDKNYPYKFILSKKQFGKFIRNGGFQERVIFVRQ